MKYKHIKPHERKYRIETLMRAFFENREYNASNPVSFFIAEDFSFLAHWHPDIEIAYVLEGSVGVGIDSERRSLEKGGMAVCGSNSIHYYDRTGGHSKIAIIIFRPEFVHDYNWPGSLILNSFFITGGQSGEKASNSVLEKIHALFISLVDDARIRDAAYPVFLKSRVMELLAILLRYFPGYFNSSPANNSSGYETSVNKPMQEALRFLENHYMKEISLSSLADSIKLSRFYLSRLFKKTTGINFNEYLNRMRVEKAEQILCSTARPVIDIAYETGFNSVRTFNRVFKSIRGIVPTALRKESRHG